MRFTGCCAMVGLNIRVCTIIQATMYGAWAIGQVFRDQWLATALCFYIPSAIVALLLVIPALVHMIRHETRTRAIAELLLAMGPLFSVLFLDTVWSHPKHRTLPAYQSEDAITLVHWNIWNGKLGRARVHTHLTDMPADIYVLAETPPVPLFTEAPQQGYYQVHRSNLSIFCKWPIQAEEIMQFKRTRAFLATTQTPAGSLKLLVVDVPSDLLQHRKEPLSWIRERICSTCPDIVVGDFNTPRSSLFLENLPKQYEHAYHCSGGWPYTWPMPLPIAAIDHAVVNRERLFIVDDGITPTTRSDHCPQTLVVRFR